MLNAATIRLVLVVCLCASLTAVARPAQAHHRDNFHCSEDLCQSARKVDGRRILGLTMAERYFRVFHLCVHDPDGYEICEPFHVRSRDNALWGRDVRWHKYFPSAGPGTYTVWWKVDHERVGAVLGFHVR